jgi:hypothetical protein
MNPTYPMFKLGDVFPSGPRERASLIRFFMSTRWLLVLLRCQERIQGEDPNEQEDLHLIFLASVAAAKEAADAFREADQFGWFEGPVETHGPVKIGGAISRARAACSKDDGSLYSALLKPVRDTVVGHWRRDVVQDLLGYFADTRFPAFEGGDRPTNSAVALTTALAMHAAGFALRADDSQVRLMVKIRHLQDDLVRIAEAAYSVAIITKRRQGAQ